MQRRDGAELVHLCRAEIADADGANFSRPVERGHGVRDLGDRRIGVRPMHLVEIDDVSLQAPQGLFCFLDDPRPAGIAKRLAVGPVEPDLGGNDGVFAAAPGGQRLADDLLGPSEAVDRRRVDQVDSAVQRRVNGANGIHLVASAPHPAADGPGSQRNAGGSN